MDKQDLQILTNWKFQTRNKIETSKIEDELNKFVKYEGEDKKIATMAQDVSHVSFSLSLSLSQNETDCPPLHSSYLLGVN